MQNLRIKEFHKINWLVMKVEFSTNFLKKESTTCTLSEVMEHIEELVSFVNKWPKEVLKSVLLVFQKLSIMTSQSLTNHSVLRLQSLKVLRPFVQHMLKVLVLIMVWVWSDWWAEMQDLLLCKLQTAVEMSMSVLFQNSNLVNIYFIQTSKVNLVFLNTFTNN